MHTLTKNMSQNLILNQALNQERHADDTRISLAPLAGLMAFVRAPSVFSCDSTDVCARDCLDVPQIGPWYEDLCALAENFTATNATAPLVAATNDDNALDQVDVFAVMIAILTAIAMVTLIWLSVMFSRSRKRNLVVVDLQARRLKNRRTPTIDLYGKYLAETS